MLKYVLWHSNFKKFRYPGITLIDILITITIISILTAIAIPKIKQQERRAKVIKAVTILRNAQKAAIIFDDRQDSNSIIDFSFDDYTVTSKTNATSYNKYNIDNIYSEAVDSARKLCIILKDSVYLPGQTGSGAGSEICVYNKSSPAKACGRWGTDSAAITESDAYTFLPNSCKCLDVSADQCT